MVNASQHGRLRIGILFGGQSVAHEISILSARNVLAALDPARFEAVLIGIDKTGRWWRQDEQKLLASARDPRLVRIEAGRPLQLESPLAQPSTDASTVPEHIDVVFPVLHGTLSEDGAIQGLLEVAGIPYVGAGVLGSAIGMDKDVMKRLLREAALPVAEFQTIRRQRFDADQEHVCNELSALGLLLFIKPANSGSSVGVRKARSPQELLEAVRYAFQFDSKVIAEAAIIGREIELAVLGDDPPAVSVAGEIIVEHADGFYSYDARYIAQDGAGPKFPLGCRRTSRRAPRHWPCARLKCLSAKAWRASMCF